MKKTTRHNGNLALLGKTHNGDKVYLARARWDCDHYYGFGYLKIFEPNKREYYAHTHWDSYFTGKKHVTPEKVDNSHHNAADGKLAETPFTESELWKLCDLMQTFYTLKEASQVYHLGNSHLTGKTHGMIKNEDVKKQIDQDTYTVIREIQELLGFENPGKVKSLPDELKRDVE